MEKNKVKELREECQKGRKIEEREGGGKAKNKNEILCGTVRLNTSGVIHVPAQ